MQQEREAIISMTRRPDGLPIVWRPQAEATGQDSFEMMFDPVEAFR
jgi:hypothetical protein